MPCVRCGCCLSRRTCWTAPAKASQRGCAWKSRQSSCRRVRIKPPLDALVSACLRPLYKVMATPTPFMFRHCAAGESPNLWQSAVSLYISGADRESWVRTCCMCQMCCHSGKSGQCTANDGHPLVAGSTRSRSLGAPGRYTTMQMCIPACPEVRKVSTSIGACRRPHLHASLQFVGVFRKVSF